MIFSGYQKRETEQFFTRTCKPLILDCIKVSITPMPTDEVDSKNKVYVLQGKTLQ